MKAQMYTGTSRGKIENDWYRCLSVFNYEDFLEESRKPFGTITTFNEEALAANFSKFYTPESGTSVVIPMIGALSLVSPKHELTINPGEIFCIDARMSFSIVNPYEDEQVNYLIIRISSFSKPGYSKLTAISEVRNTIQPAFEIGATIGRLGMFDARRKGSFEISEGRNLFVFAINGAFEIEDRLLETRDALALSDVQTVDFESLSGNAIMLLIETY